MADDNVIDPLPSDTGQLTGTESSLSNWAGDYVTDMLGQGQALANQPYQGYDGPLTAGPSDLQEQGFGGIAGLTLPDGYGDAAGMASDVYDDSLTAGDYDPTQVGTTQWDNQWAEQYMNPYVQQMLNPQLDEMRRQAEIQRQIEQGQMTQAGAYGGSRSALMNSEMDDNMFRLMNETTGKGYRDAYESAGNMFMTDKDRLLKSDMFNEQSNQFGAGLGLEALGIGLDASKTLANTTDMGFNAERDIYGDQLDAGATQRGIASEGIAADKAQFEEERDYPYKAVQYMHSLLGGMPLTAQNSTYSDAGFLSELLSGTGGIAQLLDSLFNKNPAGTTTSTPTP
jgi:hypothetical protein